MVQKKKKSNWKESEPPPDGSVVMYILRRSVFRTCFMVQTETQYWESLTEKLAELTLKH